MSPVFHSLKTRLLLLLFIPLALFAVASFYLLDTLSSTVERLSDRLYWKGNVISDFTLNADRDFYQALVAYMTLTSGQSDAAAREAALTEYADNLQEIRERITSVGRRLELGGLHELVHAGSGKTLGELVQDILVGLNEWEALTSEAIQNPASAAAAQSRINGIFETTRGNIDHIREVMELYLLEVTREEKHAAADLANATYIILAVIWVVLIAAGAWIIRRISRTVAAVSRKTRRVSEGYLDLPEMARYPKDELGRIHRDVDDMVARVRELIAGISDSAAAVSEASHELAAGARELADTSTHVADNIREVSERVETQASAAAETGRIVGEMAIGVQRIALSAERIAGHAEDTNRRAQRGSELLLKLEERMDILAGEINRLGETIAMLNDKSGEIGAIAGNISAFARQTGILSLNASIEAARAGEHGRGFTVVAGEIRRLAASSIASANSINALVADTLEAIANANGSMKATKEQVEQSSAVLREVAEGFQAIAAAIREVSGQIRDMSSVTGQMSAGSEQISAGVDRSALFARDISGKAETVATAAREQLALVGNIARAAEHLRDIVTALNRSVGYFKI